jgi:hypothetical protein
VSDKPRMLSGTRRSASSVHPDTFSWLQCDQINNITNLARERLYSCWSFKDDASYQTFRIHATSRYSLAVVGMNSIFFLISFSRILNLDMDYASDINIYPIHIRNSILSTRIGIGTNTKCSDLDTDYPYRFFIISGQTNIGKYPFCFHPHFAGS